VVQVTPDGLVRGVPEKQIWIAVAPPEQALEMVLAAVPEGWTARFAEGYLTESEVKRLKLSPGDVRALT